MKINFKNFLRINFRAIEVIKNVGNVKRRGISVLSAAWQEARNKK